MLRRWLQGLSARWPSQCAICHAWPAQAVCEGCVARFAQPRPRCRTCALPVPEGVRRCGRCLSEPPVPDLCLCAVSYQFPWDRLITQYKFGNAPGWSGALALLMRSAPWAEPALEDADLVLPMPLSVQRLRERGFNQALELARALAPAKVRHDVLLRIRHTAPQSSLPCVARLHNLTHAFAVEPGLAPMLAQRRVVLVDDVMTSGASVNAAARVLRQAGVAHITALVLARTEA